MLIQKARIKWLNHGDSNSEFFHRVMKGRRRHNHIGSILTSSEIVDSVEDVKEEVQNHFASKFVEINRDRPILEGINLNKVSQSERISLEAPFSEGEIREEIWGFGGDKSPSHDGYYFFFINKCWPFMKDDFVRCFSSFYFNASLSRSCISSFLSLIPKSSSPLGFNDYKPICLIGCIYKAISNILVSRLKLVLNSIVSQCQSAFAPGR
ncbi:uncharacterized protein LOC131626381 [Vicia villosa]|uniref:uncharacterized protein LOC131626381 n=1 Tax=Vicia villosa TaxID=3911 RepID=UPI00273B6C09|nr:uncharacterized protein LOC131626381 [Vicia villosa]